jgi:hypothetical protein
MTDHASLPIRRGHTLTVAAYLASAALATLGCSAEVLEQDDIEVLEAMEERHGVEGVGVIRQAVMTKPYGAMDYIGNIPSNKETTWFDESQGVANGLRQGEQLMFWSSNKKIDGWACTESKLFGLGKTGDDYSPKWHVGLPWGSSTWNHFGDIDYTHNAVGSHDLLYAPLEYKGKAKQPRLAVYEVKPGTLDLLGYATLDADGDNYTKEAPWIASWKARTNTDRVLSSRFDIEKGEGVDLYDINVDVPGRKVTLSYQGAMKIVDDTGEEMWLGEIQGGEMNMGGDLFLLAQLGPKGSGVYVFEQEAIPGLNRWRLADYLYAQIKRKQEQLFECHGEEFEGITVGVIDPPGSGNTSHVHALLRNFECSGASDHTNFFKHWEAKKSTNAFRQR